MASVWISPSSYSCTSERRRVRRDEGKAVGLEAVEMVLLEVSVKYPISIWSSRSGYFFSSLHTLVLRAADFAGQVSFAAGVGFQEVAAVSAENERSNGGHVCGMRLITCNFFWFVNVFWLVIFACDDELLHLGKMAAFTLRAEPPNGGRLLGKAGGGPSLGSRRRSPTPCARRMFE